MFIRLKITKNRMCKIDWKRKDGRYSLVQENKVNLLSGCVISHWLGLIVGCRKCRQRRSLEEHRLSSRPCPSVTKGNREWIENEHRSNLLAQHPRHASWHNSWGSSTVDARLWPSIDEHSDRSISDISPAALRHGSRRMSVDCCPICNTQRLLLPNSDEEYLPSIGRTTIEEEERSRRSILRVWRDWREVSLRRDQWLQRDSLHLWRFQQWPHRRWPRLRRLSISIKKRSVRGHRQSCEPFRRNPRRSLHTSDEISGSSFTHFDILHTRRDRPGCCCLDKWVLVLQQRPYQAHTIQPIDHSRQETEVYTFEDDHPSLRDVFLLFSTLTKRLARVDQ